MPTVTPSVIPLIPLTTAKKKKKRVLRMRTQFMQNYYRLVQTQALLQEVMLVSQ